MSGGGQYLSTRMPAGVMVILLASCLRDLPLPHSGAIPPLAALAVTIGPHLSRRNTLLSLIGGTTVNVALASALFTR